MTKKFYSVQAHPLGSKSWAYIRYFPTLAEARKEKREIANRDTRIVRTVETTKVVR